MKEQGEVNGGLHSTNGDKGCKSKQKLWLFVPAVLILMALSFAFGYYISQNIEIEQVKEGETNIDENIVQEDDTDEEESIPDDPEVEDIYLQLKGITQWDIEDTILDWGVINLNSTVLEDVECSSIVLLSKIYNDTALTGSDVDEQIEELRLEQGALEEEIKNLIIDDGWDYVAGPVSNDWVSNYLYSKENIYILMQIGTKDAVLGGMFINVEYCD